MALDTYGDLKAALANWLTRADLTARIPEFVDLAEADLARNLRKKVVTAAFTLDTNPKALPATCAELRSIRFNTTDRLYSLDILAHAALAAVRQPGTGIPTYAAVVNNTVMVDITPESALTMEIVYFETLTTLIGADGTTTSTFTASPDLYLYGSLIHAAPYLEHDNRVTLWQSLYQKALDDENNARERSEFGAAPLSIGLPIVFG